ncbi:MAG: hypothetical protein H7123_04545 [Thermoleophilia bacterium]|nr:hypothetical protein [Thermoleophilia bacterium]
MTACLVSAAALHSPLINKRGERGDTSAAKVHSPTAGARSASAAVVPADGPALRSRSWRGLTLRMPANWDVVANTDDHATWASSDRRQTVTIGAALDPGPLHDVTEAARAAAPAIAASAPAGRVGEVTRLSDSAGSVRVDAATNGVGMHLEQSWTRIPDADLIAIVSWTDATGHWPRWARAELPHTTR